MDLTVAVFIDYDDTLFPTHLMGPYFDAQTMNFRNVPDRILLFLQSMDKLLCSFFTHHMSYCRFRIVTHASVNWIQTTMKFLPNVARFLEWNYITILFCENLTKQQKVSEAIARERSYHVYVACGDAPGDVQCVDSSGSGKSRHILFISKPSLESYLFEWEKMHELFVEIIHSPERVLHRHFVISDHCQHQTKPEWYVIEPPSFAETTTIPVNMIGSGGTPPSVRVTPVYENIIYFGPSKLPPLQTIREN